jgi:two-component system CheB/CheR fusion protein
MSEKRMSQDGGGSQTGQDDSEHDLEILLDYLRRSRGFDFTGYKRSSLSRRVQKRMQSVRISGYLDYLDHLEVDPDEFTQLFNTILINVTGFFRDPPAWQYLRTEVLPRILAQKQPDEPVRIWSAGCASGEEAYTLAMLLAEALGTDDIRDRVKIYATDVDHEALNQARAARYSAREVEGVPPELLERYFEHNGQGYVFSNELRRAVIFGRHDLLQDAPISRVDLLVCRNTLMYFNADAQAHILGRFAFALREEGCLFLGRAEMLLAHSNMFSPVDLKRRLFRKTPRGSLRDRLMVLTGNEDHEARPSDALEGRIRESVFEASPVAQLVINSTGSVVQANRRARMLFRLSADDIGRPFQDLEVSYRPAELRSKIQQAYVERRPAPVFEVEWADGSGENVVLEVEIVPLVHRDQTLLGASVSFTDVTRSRRFQDELEHANRGLEAAYAELQSTNEELETTNEELQSTVEELETTNEELQSTNEELETMNEEMQSTNEELQTINDELGRRTAELNEVNALLESIWASLGRAVAVLDGDLRVLVWNQRSEDLWGVGQEEVQGKHLFNLDIGLPVDQVLPALRATLTSGSDGSDGSDGSNGSDGPGAHTIVVQAANRRGKPVTCLVSCSPLLGSDRQVRGVIVLIEQEPEKVSVK